MARRRTAPARRPATSKARMLWNRAVTTITKNIGPLYTGFGCAIKALAIMAAFALVIIALVGGIWLGKLGFSGMEWLNAHVDTLAHVIAPQPAAPPAGPLAPPTGTTFSLKSGDVLLVQPGSQVAGDIEVGPNNFGPWTKLFDDKPDTGLVVKFTRTAWIKAPWGASGTTDPMLDLVNALKASGCTGTCSSVIVVTQ